VKRHVLEGLAAVSLMLCVAVTALWVRSWWVDDYAFSFTDSATESWQYGVRSHRGTVGLAVSRLYGHMGNSARSGGPWWLPSRWRLSSAPAHIDMWSIYPRAYWPRVFVDKLGQPGQSMGLVIPGWMLFATTLILPDLVVRYARRAPPGKCVRCGYDLRATPDRCPECGTAAGPVA